MRLGLGLGLNRSGGSGYYILLGGVAGGSFDETTGAIGEIGTATTNLTGSLTWSILGGGDADISINSSTGAVSSARAIYTGDTAAFTVQVTNGTLTIGFPFTATGTVSAYSAEATALFARFTSDPGTTRKGHINTLIGALKTAGVWAKLDALYLTGAHDAQAAQRNWIANSYNLTPVNSPTFTTDRGYTGNGTNAYLETSFTPTTAPSPKFTQNSVSLGVWCRDNTTSATGIAMGTRGSPSCSLNPRSTSANLMRGVLNNTVNIDNYGSNATANGLSILSRSSSSNINSFYNGSANGNAARTSGAVVAFPIAVLMGNTSYSTHEVFAAFIGSNLAGAEVTALYNALDAYRSALGA